MDALVQVVHLHEMLAPPLVDDLDQNAALDLPRGLGPAGEGLLPLVVELEGFGEDALGELHHARRLLEVLNGEPGRVVLRQLQQEALEIPFLGEVVGAVVRDDAFHRPGEQRLGMGLEVLAVDDLKPPLVDDLALFVSHLVVLEQLLAGLGVAALDGVLGSLDCLGDHACLDRHVIGQGSSHDPADGTGREQPHQLVLERQVEPALAAIALAPGPAPELVVDAPALVALAPEDVEATDGSNLVRFGGALLLELPQQRLVERPAFVRVEVEPLGADLVLSETFGVASEHDVDATSGHVRGDGYGMKASRLSDDHSLLGVVLGVQNVVRDALLVQEQGQLLGLRNRCRADEDRLAAVVAFLQVLDDRLELGRLRLEDQVRLIDSDHGAVRRDRNDVQLVGRRELGRLGLGGTGHPGELLVHAEVVLERDCRPRVVLVLDPDTFFGLDSLVKAIGPASPLHDPACELVDDLHLAVGHQIVLVPVVELLGLECLLELMDVVHRDRVVQVGDPELPLDFCNAGLGRHSGALLLVDFVIGIAPQSPHDACKLVVELRRLVRGPGDDERRPGLVDQDRVDLVDDPVDVLTLHHVLALRGHVVTQVVEAHLGVRPVGHVRAVRRGLDGKVVYVGSDETHRQSEEPVDLAHPVGVTPRQVVVDGDDMHAATAERVQIDRERRDESLPLTCLHLRDPPEVQSHATHELDVEVALADGANSRLTYHGESLHEEVVHVLAVIEALFELDGPAGQLRVGQGLDLWLKRVDRGHDGSEAANLLAFARAKYLPEHTHDRPLYAAAPAAPGRRLAVAVLRLALQPATTGIRSPTRRPEPCSPETRAPARWCGAACSTRTLTKVPGARSSPSGGAKCTSLPWRVRPESTSGSFLDGPSTMACSIRPMRLRLRASADRSITTLSRSKRPATTWGGTYSSVICAARVPGLGEKMNV